MRRATRAGPMGAPWVYYIYVYWLLPIAYSIYMYIGYWLLPITYSYTCIYCLLLMHTHDSANVWLVLLSVVYWAPRLLSQPLPGAPEGAAQ